MASEWLNVLSRSSSQLSEAVKVAVPVAAGVVSALQSASADRSTSAGQVMVTSGAVSSMRVTTWS